MFVPEGVLTTYVTDGSKGTAYEWACYNMRYKRDDLGLSINHRNSVGFGDSEHDISFLKMTGNPVAVNPSRTLRNFAEENGWLIVSPEDDVLGKVTEYIEGFAEIQKV